LKLLIVLLVTVAFVVIYFFYQGSKSARLKAPAMSGGKLPVCGSKPNCVCSQQSATDSHYVESIPLNDLSIDTVKTCVEELGGAVLSADNNQLHAIFTSSLFRFVDDLLLSIEGDELHVRSSSRVGHSDLGANRKRIERLRKILS